MSTAISWETKLLEAIDASSEELLDLAGLLIQTPSENPEGDCTEIASVIAEYFTDHGIDTELLDAGEGRVSVVAHRGTKYENDRYLVLSGHHDVVPVGDTERWSFPPFAGDVVDGWLRGRGASDMKAGLAGLMHVLTLINRLDIPLKGKLSFASVPDEETGGPLGAHWLLEQGVLEGATGGIIAEPTERDHPTIGQKGSNWFRLTVRGTPGHGSLQPLHGKSANLLGAKAVLALQKLWDMKPVQSEELKQLLSDSKLYAAAREGYGPDIGDVFEHVTINVGKISGGTSTNVIADTCVIEFDTRVPLGLSREQVNTRVFEILSEEGIEAEIEYLGFMSEANWTPPSDPIVETLVTALRELSDPQALGVLQWASSDARTFRSHGIPVLQYGPADLQTIHNFDERALASDVVLAAKVYALTTLRYLGLAE